MRPMDEEVLKVVEVIIFRDKIMSGGNRVMYMLFIQGY